MEDQTTYHDTSGLARGPVVGRPEALARLPRLDAQIWAAADQSFPVRVPRLWLDAMDPENPQDPLALQALPDARELLPDPGDLEDPVGEQGLSPVPWLIRKHPDRALLLLTRRCHMYCRYCFRRTLPDSGREDPTDAELEAALAYCRGAGVRELILSGGDPLAVRDERLFAVIDAARPQILTIRVHTRAPLTAPQRVTDALVRGLSERRPVWVLVHTNHARELGAEARAALGRLVDAGVPVLNQTVLLRGVNDDADALADLCESLVSLRVFPYYLHLTDQVRGNAHLRVDAGRALALHAALAARVSGIALPRLVVDPPDGSGKIPVDEALRRGSLTAERGRNDPHGGVHDGA